ncbi:hypothetical protein, partial [Streptomyces sp. NPDC052036]|uniref:hypothetical protein n=1 Tax=Streptomyces sp. NPDC052036 TaxID=3155171 RepID=UPI00342EDDA6
AGVPVAAEGGDEEVAAPSDVELQYPADEFWNTPSGSAAGVPRGTAHLDSAGTAPHWAGGDPTAFGGPQDTRALGSSAPGRRTSRDRIGYVPGLVIQRLAAGEPPLPFRVSDVTGGMADPERERMAFRIAIDFHAKDHLEEQQVVEKLNIVLAEMHAEGLSRQDFPQWGDSSGWQISPTTDLRALSLISPWLSDTKKDWSGLRTVLSLMRDGEFSPFSWGSARVLVDVPGGLSEDEQRVLTDVVRGHQDVLFRLAADPVTGHGPRHVRALPAPDRANGPADGLLPVDPLMAVRAAEPGSPYVDFPLWTASFDEGLVQARVLLSLGLVSGARRLAQDPSWESPVAVPPGTHAGEVQIRASGTGMQAVYRLDDPSETEGLASLLDATLPRLYDRDVVSALFATTRWFGGLAGQEPGPDNWFVPAEFVGLDDLVPLARLTAVVGGNGASLARSEDVGPEKVLGLVKATAGLFGHQQYDAFPVALTTDEHSSLPLLYGRGGQAPVRPETFAQLVKCLGWSPERSLLLVPIGGMLNEPGLLWLGELATVLGQPVHVLFDWQDLGGQASSSHDGPFVQRFTTKDKTRVDILGEQNSAAVFGWVRVLPRRGFTLPDGAWPARTWWKQVKSKDASESDELMDTSEDGPAGYGDPMDTTVDVSFPDGGPVGEDMVPTGVFDLPGAEGGWPD